LESITSWSNLPYEWLATAVGAVTRDHHYVEWAALVALFLWLRRKGREAPAGPSPWERKIARFASSRWKCYALVGVLAGLPRLALLAVRGYPAPFIPDEFSYQLQGLTFAAGRLANPPQALWQHFEAIHVLPQPTYSSMYMPMQGLALAAGQVLTGHIWWGVWASGIAAALGLLWMLRGWFPPAWALAGAVLVTARLCLFSYWTTSYWGGFLPLLGGALAAGGYARIVRRGDWRGGAAFGLVAVIGVLSRPFESVLLLSALGLGLVYAFTFGPRRGEGKFAIRAAAPLLALGVVGAAGMLHYFQTVTGDARTMPYAVNQHLYGWPLTLPWMNASQKEFRHEKQKRYLEFELREHQKITDPAGILIYAPYKISTLWAFYFGPAFSLALLGVGWAWRREGKRRILFASTGVVVAGVLIEQSGYPHYLAPGGAVTYGVWLAALRGLRAAAWRAGPIEWRIAKAVPALAVFTLFVVAVSPSRYGHLTGSLVSWCCHWEVEGRRVEVERVLRNMPGKDLVFVKSPKDRELFYDWVYNEPDFDNAQIIWAEDMGEEANRKVRAVYAGRSVWHVEAGAGLSTLLRLF
jgi:hypothetical protein